MENQVHQQMRPNIRHPLVQGSNMDNPQSPYGSRHGTRRITMPQSPTSENQRETRADELQCICSGSTRLLKSLVQPTKLTNWPDLPEKANQFQQTYWPLHPTMHSGEISSKHTNFKLIICLGMYLYSLSNVPVLASVRKRHPYNLTRIKSLFAHKIANQPKSMIFVP